MIVPVENKELEAKVDAILKDFAEVLQITIARPNITGVVHDPTATFMSLIESEKQKAVDAVLDEVYNIYLDEATDSLPDTLIAYLKSKRSKQS